MIFIAIILYGFLVLIVLLVNPYEYSNELKGKVRKNSWYLFWIPKLKRKKPHGRNKV